MEYCNEDLMGKVRRRFNILDQQLVNKPLVIPQTLQLVSEIGPSLRTFQMAVGTLDLNVAAGTTVSVFQVPSGYLYTVLWATWGASTGNTAYQLTDGTSQVVMGSVGTTGGVWTYGPYPIPEGWTWGLRATENAGDGARSYATIYTVEKYYTA